MSCIGVLVTTLCDKSLSVTCGRSPVFFGILMFPPPIKLPVQSVPITTKVESSNPVHGKVYSIQHNVIKAVINMRQVGDFLRVLWFPAPIKLIATI